MRKILQAKALLALIPLLMMGRPANSLVGADGADIAVARYTVVVANSKGRCSGVVLAQNIVLTAAHCLLSGLPLTVAGHPGLGDPGRKPAALSPVIEAVPHPLYKPADGGSPDLAILKLAKPLPDRFLPAELNARGLSIGDDVIAAGYGKGAANESLTKAVLRAGLLRVSDSVKGWVMLANAGADPSRAAPGDSGGPVFSYRGMYSLVGLVVAVTPDRTKAVAIAAHYIWIKDTMEKMGAN